ncbi:MAG: type II toxin-antitoxin system RelE/ParE family toxin [Proteobacteria bacterium]|nr:type II toxin-antitoxin system RelE/ParE family toxin [Pseudomonadota bacterium]
MELLVHPVARRELAQALDWCGDRYGRDAADRLLNRFFKVGELLLREPEIGTPSGRRAREFPLQRFPFTLVYRIEGESIHVVALKHQRRMPGYWAGR